MAYSDREQMEALILLAINSYDFDKTAKTLGMSAKTLRRWDKNVPKKGVEDLLERAVERLLMSIPKKMSAHEWGVALGILMDKWLLIQGEPTARTETIQRQVSQLTDDEYDQLLRDAHDILEESRGGRSASADRDDDTD